MKWSVYWCEHACEREKNRLRCRKIFNAEFYQPSKWMPGMLKKNSQCSTRYSTLFSYFFSLPTMPPSNDKLSDRKTMHRISITCVLQQVCVRARFTNWFIEYTRQSFSYLTVRAASAAVDQSNFKVYVVCAMTWMCIVCACVCVFMANCLLTQFWIFLSSSPNFKYALKIRTKCCWLSTIMMTMVAALQNKK